MKTSGQTSTGPTSATQAGNLHLQASRLPRDLSSPVAPSLPLHGVSHPGPAHVGPGSFCRTETGGGVMPSIEIGANADPLLAALRSLEELVEGSPERERDFYRDIVMGRK